MALSGQVQKIAFTPDSRRLEVLDGDKRTWQWSLNTPSAAQPIAPGARFVTPAPDDRRELVSDLEGLKVFDAAGRALRTLLPGVGVGDNAWSPDGKTVAVIVESGKAIAIGSPDAGQLKTVYRAGAGETIQTLGFTLGGGRLLVISSGAPVALLDPSSGRLVGRIGTARINALGLVAGGDDVLIAGPGAVGELYGPDGKRKASFVQPSKPLPPALAAMHLPNFDYFSDITGDSKAGLVATVNPLGGATLWNAVTGAAVGKVADAAALGAFRFVLKPGADGWAAEANANSTIAVWSWPKMGVAFSAAPARRLSDPSGYVTWMRPTPDGRLLALVKGKTLTLWDPATGRKLVQYDNVAQARPSPDGRVVILMGADGVVRRAVLPLSGQALITAARAKGGGLSPEERARFFLAAN